MTTSMEGQKRPQMQNNYLLSKMYVRVTEKGQQEQYRQMQKKEKDTKKDSRMRTRREEEEKDENYKRRKINGERKNKHKRKEIETDGKVQEEGDTQVYK